MISQDLNKRHLFKSFRFGVAAAVVFVFVATFLIWRVTSTGPQVAGQQTAPAELNYLAPSYVLVGEKGLIVQAGEDRILLKEARAGTFLPSGLVFVNTGLRRTKFAVFDPSTKTFGDEFRPKYPDAPGRSVSRINLLNAYDEPAVLTSFDSSFQSLDSIVLPGTNDPGVQQAGGTRGYYNVAATVGDYTFILWHDGSDLEDYEDGDYGLLRIHHLPSGDSVFENFAINQRLVALYLSADGASLLALQQAKGKPCGGCDVKQNIVEIDVTSGELINYGQPDSYDSEWRVAAIDRVGDSVAVRYHRTSSDQQQVELVGTFVYQEGSWSMLPDSDRFITWWQTGGSILGRPSASGDVENLTFSWIKAGESQEQPIVGKLAARNSNTYRTGSIPGQLLPPSRQ